jgi:DNA-binding response OmpR family regulator
MAHKILVVDDEKPIRELLRHKLSIAGFEVITAKDDKEFSSIAERQKPDLIILDIWLRDRIGTDVYNNLLQNGVLNTETPVIFITALVEGHPKKDTSITDGRKYVLYSKPFNFEKLLSEINGFLIHKTA